LQDLAILLSATADLPALQAAAPDDWYASLAQAAGRLAAAGEMAPPHLSGFLAAAGRLDVSLRSGGGNSGGEGGGNGGPPAPLRGGSPALASLLARAQSMRSLMSVDEVCELVS
jgi:hypothetical protein